MARQAGVSIENNFVGGLVTETTNLNAPENTCSETWNCVFDKTGKVSRRKGFVYEDGHTAQSILSADATIVEYLWEAVAGDGSRTILVQQIGSRIYLWDIIEGNPLSQNLLATSFHLINFATSGASLTNLRDNTAQFAAGHGKLVVVHPYCEPFYIHVHDDGTFEAHEIDIQIRDFKGVDDGLSIDERPTTLTNAHKYNLYNQGWLANVTGSGGFGDETSRIETFEDAVGAYPSNADVWWLYKKADGTYDPTATQANVERGNSPAPKGAYILSAFNQDRSAISGISGLDVVSAGARRPSSAAFFAGRVFYAGVASDGFATNVYFTQIIEDEEDFGKCYQENDPSSEDRFDLLPSDGGVIVIPALGTVHKMFVMDSFLVVFASNGVWSITGSQGIGFAANDYTVKKMTNIPSISPLSFVDVGGAPAWWNNEGINIVQITAQGPTVSSLTDKTVKTFFETIPLRNKKYAKGAYSRAENVIRWVYRSHEATTTAQNYSYDTILNISVDTGAVYPWSIPGFAVIKGILYLSADTTFKYMVTLGGADMTFAECRSDTYTDWGTNNYTSYFDTAAKIRGDAARKFQTNYIYLFSDVREEDSVYVLQGRWDWSTTGVSGDFGQTQRIETMTGNHGYTFTRRKLRGHGIAVHLRITSVEGEPFNLTGWSIFETSNTTV